MCQYHGMNLGQKADARRALTEMAKAAADVALRQADLRDRLEKWRAVVAGARAMTEQVVSDRERIASTLQEAVKHLVELPVAKAAEVPVDYSSAKNALASLSLAVQIRDTFSKASTNAEAELAESLRRLTSVEGLIVAAGTLTKEEAQTVSSRAFESARLPVELLDGANALSGRPIVDIMVLLLKRSGKPLPTGEIVRMMEVVRRPVQSVNPAGSIRSA